MGIKITIEVDTSDELEYILSNWKTERGTVVTKTASDTPNVPKKRERLTSFFKEIKDYPRQFALLQTLYENPDGVIDDELKTKLNLDTGQALGGTLSSLTWKAKRFSLEGTDVVTGEDKKDTQGIPRWHYKLTPQMMEVMKQV
jgi:hypothetical protein